MELHDESHLITIGEFASLGGVSIKALRIYAEMGLLQPAAINTQSRYRLYSKSQISKLHRILMLKNAGLSLAQVASHLGHRDETTLSNIRAGLMSRAEEIRQQLAWIDDEIRTSQTMVIKRAPEMRVLSQRHKINSYGEADDMLRDLAKKAPTAARIVAGAIWHDCGARTNVIDCEVFWVLNRDLHASKTTQLAGATIASILHEGDESTIGETYQAARHWITGNGYEVSGPNREIYLGPQAKALTEIQFPVRRRS